MTPSTLGRIEERDGKAITLGRLKPNQCGILKRSPACRSEPEGSGKCRVCKNFAKNSQWKNFLIKRFSQ